MKVYKIRHKETGEFYSQKKPSSMTWPHVLAYTPTGKTWSKIGSAKSAMAVHEELVNECEVVEFEATEHCTYQPGGKKEYYPRVWEVSYGMGKRVGQ